MGIRNCFSIVMVLLLLCLLPWTVLAEETEETEITLQQAVDRALELSKSLKQSEINKEMAWEQRKDAQKEVSYTPTGMVDPDIESAYASLLQAELSYQMQSKDYKALQEDIKAEVVEKYCAVQSAEGSQQAAEAALENAKYQRNISNLKRQFGLITDSEMGTANTDVQQQEAALKQAQSSLDTARFEFNVLVGYSADKRLRLVTDVAYAELEVNSITAEVNRAIGTSVDVWQALQNITLEEQDLRMSQKSYEMEKLDIEIAELQAEEARENLEKSVRDMITSVENLREDIALAEVNLKKSEEALETAEKELRIGVGIQADVKRAEAQLVSDRNSLVNLRSKLASLMASYNNLTGRQVLPVET